MHDYLVGYEKELSTLVAEERLPAMAATDRRCRRRNDHRRHEQPGRRDIKRVRSLVSEVAFVPLPGNVGWLGYRDVVRIGGRPVRRKGPSLVDLLKAQTDDSQERAMTLLLESARHNLGAARTINLPSLPLELLHTRNQARFVISGPRDGSHGPLPRHATHAGRDGDPNPIQNPKGGNMPSRLFAWVDPENGRLCRAEVRTHDAQHGSRPIEAVVRVEFAREPALDVWVPEKMYEEFLYPPRGRGEGEATYTNYRRFTTSARIVP